MLLLLESASRLIDDKSGVESKLCTDILETELGEDGMYIGQVLFQHSLLESCTVESMWTRSGNIGLCCIKGLID